MKLWWLNTPYGKCSLRELKMRSAVCLGWTELGPLNRYVKDKPGWERQFKTFVQIKGDIAYRSSEKWKNSQREFDQVPNVFWQLLSIKKDDLIITLETGNPYTRGTPIISAIGQAGSDALKSYQFNDSFTYGHSVCDDTNWLEWDSMRYNDFSLPANSFLGLTIDEFQLDYALKIWSALLGKEQKKTG